MLRVLARGDLEIVGRMPYASNATLLARVACDGITGLAVYKPRRGESPLWDFPDGTLFLRERAAWLLDATLGWELVPPTIVRDGPAGVGMVQLFVDEDPGVEFESLLDTHPDELRRVALFDLVVNNADRKAGHFLVDRMGKLWAIDHGVTFNVEHKLRTVLWVFGGEAVPDRLADDLGRVRRALRGGTAPVAGELGGLLRRAEIDALVRRIERVLDTGRYPEPGPGRRHVPWPPW